MSKLSERVFTKIIMRTIRDLASTKQKRRDYAERYIKSPTFTTHLDGSGLPENLRDALLDVAQLSLTEQKKAVKQIIAELKKTPSVRGRSQNTKGV